MAPSQLELRTRMVGPWPMNTYALVCPVTRASILVDPGADPDALSEMLAGTTPIAMLITHSHMDHTGAVEEMRTRLNIPLLAHPGPHASSAGLNVDRTVSDRERIQVGEHFTRIYYTPGHTADQVCIAAEGGPHILVGDTIFDGGPGKTWSAEDFQTTLKTLREVILKWDDATICHPGHGP